MPPTVAEMAMQTMNTLPACFFASSSSPYMSRNEMQMATKMAAVATFEMKADNVAIVTMNASRMPFIERPKIFIMKNSILFPMGIFVIAMDSA